MNKEIEAILEKLISHIAAKNDGIKDIPTPDDGPPDPASGDLSTVDLHTRVRMDSTEVIWDFPEITTEGNRGKDGGPISKTTRYFLNTSESVLGVDERTMVSNTEEYPWRMIASLELKTQSSSLGSGTGFMIGPTTVLTAGHCVYSQRAGGWLDEITVRPGRNGTTQPYGSHKVVSMSTVTGWIDHFDPKYDYGFLELEEPVGNETGWFSLGVVPDFQLINKPITVCGYPVDLDPTHQWVSNGNILHVEEQRIYHDADTHGGNSGGPVWVTGINDSQTITGIHTNGIGASVHLGQLTNSGTRIVPQILQK